jgi:Grx4 family monothiol glutaredoxin
MASSTLVKDFTDTAPPAPGLKTVLLFWADWHEASVAGGPMDLVLGAMAGSATPEHKMQFGRVQAEDCPALTETYSVTAVPTFVLLNAAGTTLDKIEGGEDVAAVTVAVQRLMQAPIAVDSGTDSGAVGVESTATSAEDQLTKRLDRLVRSSEVMVFMKGSPTAPRCGFSRQVVEMLQEESIPFGSFDILTDDAVRQGLKTFSDWPTFPQLYVNGEFAGGLDILKEMKESRDGASLKEQLDISDAVTAAPSLNERLAALVKRHHIMLFMKGLPSAPQCGFSRQIVAMLDAEGVSYDAFNILEDDEVRAGLKTYSNWPTFPQLYVDGDLIGGLDIVQEMKEEGSLKDVL